VKNKFAAFGRDILMQAFHAVGNTGVRVFEGAPCMNIEFAEFLVEYAKRKGLREPGWNGDAWVIPEE